MVMGTTLIVWTGDPSENGDPEGESSILRGLSCFPLIPRSLTVVISTTSNSRVDVIQRSLEMEESHSNKAARESTLRDNDNSWTIQSLIAENRNKGHSGMTS